MSAFTYADLIATVDGLTARKKTLAERIGELATDPALGRARRLSWPR
jgi:hypothetical protein